MTLELSPVLSTDAPAVVATLGTLANLVTLRESTKTLLATGIQAQRLLDSVREDIELIPYLEVTDDESLAEAQQRAGRLAHVCSDTGALEKERQALTAPFVDLQRALNAGYAPARAYVQTSLTEVQGKILAYGRKVAAEKAAAEAAEAKRRQEAADAAAEVERKAKADADDLLARAEKAQGEGATATAGMLATEASQVIDAGRQAVQAAQQVMHQPMRVAGGSAPKGQVRTWSVEETSLENLIVHVAARIAAGDRSLIPLLAVDLAAAKKKAALEKEGFNVPGLRAVAADSLRTRKVAV